MQTQTLAIGCSIHGVDARCISDGELAEIKDLLYRNRLIVLKDQSLTEQEYCDFASRIGFPVPYLQDNYHHPEYPLIFVSSNVRSKGKPMGVPRTGGYWHSDTSFESDPKFITMLMPKVLPSVPRSTRFIDMSEVYAALPAKTKKRLVGAEFLHSGRMRFKIRPDCVGLDISEILAAIDKATPPVRHPAVAVHPYTKERFIYGSRGFVIGIADRGLDESAELLSEIFDLAETDRFIREVQWSMGDIIIWDNRFLQHSSGRNPGPEEETMMYRITLKDGMPVCAGQMKSKAA